MISRFGSDFILDPELEPLWPEYPSLIAEVPIIRIDRNTTLIIGMRQSTALKGPGISEKILKLLSKIDGDASAIELIASSKDKDGDIRVLTALIQSGAIESNAIYEPTFRSEGPHNFISRVSQLTGWNESRSDVHQRAAKVKVSLVGSQKFTEELKYLLEESGIRQVSLLNSCDDSSVSSLGSSDYIIAERSAHDAMELLSSYGRKDARIVCFSIEESGFQIGPSFEVRDFHKFSYAFLPIPQVDNSAEYFLPMLAHILFGYVLDILDFPLYRKGYRMCWEPDKGLQLEQITYGNITCYPANHLSPKSVHIKNGQVLDELLATIEMPPKYEIAPAAHLWHYDEKNVQLAKSYPHSINAVDLISLTDFNAEIGDRVSADRMSIFDRLSGLLFYCGGVFHTTEHSKRVAPSGGNISAVEIYVEISRCDDIMSGVYRYNATNHVLELVRKDPSVFNKSNPDVFRINFVASTNKVEAKYGLYAYHLLRYDCGVIREYLRNASDIFDVQLGARGAVSGPEYLRQIPRTTNSFMDCGFQEFEFSNRDISSNRKDILAREGKFRSIVFSRYACRFFDVDQCDVAFEVFEKVLKHEAVQRIGENGLTLECFLIITCGSQADGIYTQVDGDISLACAISPDYDSELLMNQSTLGKAPFKIIPWLYEAGIDSFFQHETFSELLEKTARLITYGWLQLPSYSLVGTAAGGAIRSEIEKVIPENYAGGTPLLTLCFGSPSSNVKLMGDANE